MEIPEENIEGMKFIFVKRIEEVLEHALVSPIKGGKKRAKKSSSRSRGGTASASVSA